MLAHLHSTDHLGNSEDDNFNSNNHQLMLNALDSLNGEQESNFLDRIKAFTAEWPS